MNALIDRAADKSGARTVLVQHSRHGCKDKWHHRIAPNVMFIFASFSGPISRYCRNVENAVEGLQLAVGADGAQVLRLA